MNYDKIVMTPGFIAGPLDKDYKPSATVERLVEIDDPVIAIKNDVNQEYKTPKDVILEDVNRDDGFSKQEIEKDLKPAKKRDKKPPTMDISHIRIEALEGLDPDLRYLLYVNAKGDDGSPMIDRKSFMDALTGLQEWLRSVGIQALLIPVTGRDDDLKITAVEIRTEESNG